MNVHNVQAELMRRVAERDPKPSVLLLDVSGTSNTSVTVMDVFAETDKQLEAEGVSLWVAALPTRAVTKLRRAAAWEEWAQSGRVHPTLNAALDAYEARVL